MRWNTVKWCKCKVSTASPKRRHGADNSHIRAELSSQDWLAVNTTHFVKCPRWKPQLTGLCSCASCRQRKIKCDRQLPDCGFCKQVGVRCSYLQPQKKRGLRAGYVSTLESRLGMAHTIRETCIGLTSYAEKLEQEVQTLKTQQQSG